MGTLSDMSVWWESDILELALTYTKKNVDAGLRAVVFM